MGYAEPTLQFSKTYNHLNIFSTIGNNAKNSLEHNFYFCKRKRASKSLPVILVFTLKILYQRGLFRKGLQMTTILLVSASVMSYTLITELPDSHNSPERETMTKVSQVYAKSEFAEFKTYVNHSWFFWANNFDRDKNKYNEITQENLEKAPDLINLLANSLSSENK